MGGEAWARARPLDSPQGWVRDSRARRSIWRELMAGACERRWTESSLEQTGLSSVRCFMMVVVLRVINL